MVTMAATILVRMAAEDKGNEVGITTPNGVYEMTEAG
jgi:hypothetical protein